MKNGSVWDIRSNDQFKTIEKKLLIQLPNSRGYHTFLTNSRVLNFVKEDLSSNIIQYQKSLNNHVKIKKSAVKIKGKVNTGFLDFSGNTDVNLSDGMSFRYGIQVGSMFWLVSGYRNAVDNPNESEAVAKISTMLWFSKKQRWRRGPDLPLSHTSFTNFCLSSLNSTAILFVFTDGKTNTFVTNVSIFNFQFKVWTDIPRMKEKLQELPAADMQCTMATLFDKQARPRVVVVFNLFVFDAFSNSLRYLNTLYSVDLNLNNDASWKQESTWFDQEFGM